jgi:chemotaxis protein CheZ
MTEEAAEKTLNAVDRAQPIQEELNQGAVNLGKQWDSWLSSSLDETAVRSLVLDTHEFLASVPRHTDATNKELLEIMMAQDFQDLTGQVIKKLMDLVVDVEHQLLDVIVDSMYPEKEREEVRRRINEQANCSSVAEENSLLNGPQINPSASDAVSSQDQVDDLLDELGF